MAAGLTVRNRYGVRCSRRGFDNPPSFKVSAGECAAPLGAFPQLAPRIRPTVATGGAVAVSWQKSESTEHVRGGDRVGRRIQSSRRALRRASAVLHVWIKKWKVVRLVDPPELAQPSGISIEKLAGEATAAVKPKRPTSAAG